MSVDLIAPPSVKVRDPVDPYTHPQPNPKHPYTHSLQVTYPSADVALTVFRSVSVDEEIRPERIYRHLRLEGSVMHCFFSAVELHFLRVSVSSFLEMLALATDTAAQFSLSQHA